MGNLSELKPPLPGVKISPISGNNDELILGIIVNMVPRLRGTLIESILTELHKSNMPPPTYVVDYVEPLSRKKERFHIFSISCKILHRYTYDFSDVFLCSITGVEQLVCIISVNKDIFIMDHRTEEQFLDLIKPDDDMQFHMIQSLTIQ